MNKILTGLGVMLLLAGCAATTTKITSSNSSGIDDPFELTAMADFAYDRGDWLVAAREYQQLAQLVPNDAYALTRLGNVRLKQNDFEGAIHAYGKALERNPQAARAHYNLATAHLLLARDSLQASLRSLPRNDGGALVINKKLKHFDALVYEPLIETSSPNKGLIKKN